MITALSPPGDLLQYLRVDKQGGREWRFKVGEDMPSGLSSMYLSNFTVCVPTKLPSLS